MACSASAVSAALISSNPSSFSSRKPSSLVTDSLRRTVAIANGLGEPFLSSRLPRSAASSRNGSRSRRSFVVRATFLEYVKHLHSMVLHMLEIQHQISRQRLFDQEFINVKISDYIGKKYLILFFYPLDFTFVCLTGLLHITTDCLLNQLCMFSHLAWVQTERKSGGLGNLKYSLISDVTKTISKSYGVLIPDQGIALRGSLSLTRKE